MHEISKMTAFLSQNGLKSKDIDLIMEAYRRKFMFHENKGLENTWLGLGTPSEYKSDLFRPFDGKSEKRVRNWYVLTAKGVDILTKLSTLFPFPTRHEDKLNLNNRYYGLPDGFR